jgi:ABC-type transporter MlaC component
MKKSIFILVLLVIISCNKKDNQEPSGQVQKGRLEMEFSTQASRVHIKYKLNNVAIEDVYKPTNYYKLDTMVSGKQPWMAYITESMSEHGQSYNTLLVKFNGDTLLSFKNQFGQCGGSGILP